MRLCGITSRFQLLSPCMRQVTHALLTRPPLSHKRLQTEVICLKCFVRLACVKHAASVHPEPGSNSHKNVFLSETHARLLTQLAKSLKTRVLNPVSFELTSFNSFLILCLRIHSIAWMMFTKDVDVYIINILSSRNSKKNFQGCLSVQLSKSFVVSNQRCSLTAMIE